MRNSEFGMRSVRARRALRGRRGLVLVVVLVMVTLLALLAAAYAFLVRANLDTVMSNHYRFQARMAAESGYQRAVALLRESRGQVDTWYNNPKEFQKMLVVGTEGQDAFAEQSNVDEYDPNATAAWRCNVVAPNFDDPSTVRWGLTDECARLDLNSASEQQLRTLLGAVLPVNQDPEQQIDENILIESLLDWRESGTNPRPNGAKDEFYLGLSPAYRCKKALFSTVEELLLVRGWTGWVLFGEDYNRNGLLDPNEDDGDESFPPDNQDGLLFRGVAPYLTVWSRAWNLASDGKQKININERDTQKLQEKLDESGLPGDVISYIMQVRGSGKPFNSVMNLIPAPPPEETDEQGSGGDQNNSSTQPPGSNDDDETSGEIGAGNDQGTPPGNTDGNQSPDTSENKDASGSDDQDGGLQRVGRDVGNQQEANEGAKDASGGSQPSRSDRQTPRRGTRGGNRGAQQPGAGGRPTAGGGGNRGSAGNQQSFEDLTPEPPPGGIEDLPLILDRLTTDPSPISTGRVNINTAPREVLLTLPGLDAADVEAIVTTRAALPSEDKLTPAWLLSQGVLDQIKFRRVLPRLTTAASVFRVESVGFADHVGVVERLHIVFEMIGPTPQVLYYRNLSGLGTAYSPHGEDKRGLEGQSGQ